MFRFVKACSTNMSCQRKISSFFKTSLQQNMSLGGEPEAKKAKLSQTPEKTSPSKEPEDRENIPVETTPSSPQHTSMPPSPALSPEQKKRMEDNKFKAEVKLVAKTTCGLTADMGESWFKALKVEFSKPYFIKLSEFVAEERKKATIFPPPQDVFSFTRHCDINKVKVVILGQDPYHGPNQAHGLCFSVQKGVPPPPSLVNMYKTLENDIPGFTRPNHGYLGGWAEQGVLLLNAVLTVRAHNANSHKDKGWEQFTDAVISHINKHLDSVVFILWGAYAQKKGQCIKKDRHCILKGVHPSPLSAHRGFFQCGHFSKCNEYLTSKNRKPINWNNLPLP